MIGHYNAISTFVTRRIFCSTQRIIGRLPTIKTQLFSRQQKLGSTLGISMRPIIERKYHYILPLRSSGTESKEQKQDQLLADLLNLENINFEDNKKSEEHLKKELQREFETATQSEISAEYALLVGFYKEQLGDLEGAEKDYLHAVNLQPESFEAHRHLAVLYHKQEKIEKAIKHYEIICSRRQEYFEMLSNLAVCYVRVQQYDKAISLYHKILRKHDDPRIWINLSSAYLLKGELDLALNCVERVLKSNPKDPMAIYNKGVILEKEGKLVDALHCVGQSLVSQPKEYRVKEKFDELVQKAGGLDKLPPEIGNYLKQWETAKRKVR
jgi:tetratricopeptide (TPR) repeat protein